MIYILHRSASPKSGYFMYIANAPITAYALPYIPAAVPIPDVASVPVLAVSSSLPSSSSSSSVAARVMYRKKRGFTSLGSSERTHDGTSPEKKSSVPSPSPSASSSSTSIPLPTTTATDGGGSGGYTVFVSNLSPHVTVADLQALFSECGVVTGVRLAMDDDDDATRTDTGGGAFSKGFAHIDFADLRGVHAAVKLTDTKVAGRAIRVEYVSWLHAADATATATSTASAMARGSSTTGTIVA